MKTGKQILAWILCLAMLWGALPPRTQAETLPADVSDPADGSFLADVAGQVFSCGKDSALRRLNTYRYQACYYGDKDPRDATRSLALADRSGGEEPSDAVLAKANGDYVPAVWSYELERIAEIRAAESSVYMSHTRPNGKSCFSVKVNGVTTSAECLAWGSSMLGGMQQWYGERSAWLGTGSGETGHYVAMINPAYRSYGIAAFSDNGAIFVTVALEARRLDTGDQRAIGRTGRHVQRMEISQSALTGVSADGQKTMCVGETQALTANADVRFGGLNARTATFPVVKGR